MSKKKAPPKEFLVAHPFKRWLLLLVAGIVVLIATYFGALWLYHTGKVWRARSLAREATELLDHQAPAADAQDKLMAAYHLASYDAEVIRACARYSLSQADPTALEFYQQLISLPDATRDDKRAALRACLLFGNLNTAAQLAEILTTHDPEPDDWVCKAQVLWQMKDYADAVPLMRQQIVAVPDNRSYQFLLAQMLASLSDDPGQEEALATFRKLAQGKDQASLDSLVAISRATGLDKSSLKTVLTQLQNHPLRDDNSRFAAWELEARLGDRPPKVVLQEVVDYYKSSDLAHKSRAARWLYGQTQPELAMELATPSVAIESKDLFLVRLDALAYMNDWSEVSKELTDTHIPISQTLVYLYRARAAKEMGDPTGSAANWDQARGAATAEPGMLTYLGNYALKTGVYEEAQKTFVLMTQSPTQAEEGYTDLVQLISQHGSATDLLETLRQMTTALPKKPEAKNDWAYLSLLLNLNLVKAAQAAHDLVNDHPEMLAYRSTLALAYLRQSDFSGAAKVYQGQQIDWQSAPSSWKMIYAVVLTASGDPTSARSMAHTIELAQLKPVERDFLNSWLPGPY